MAAASIVITTPQHWVSAEYYAMNLFQALVIETFKLYLLWKGQNKVGENIESKLPMGSFKAVVQYSINIQQSQLTFKGLYLPTR